MKCGKNVRKLMKQKKYIDIQAKLKNVREA